MTVTIKPTRWKHSSGYRRIQVKTETIDATYSDDYTEGYSWLGSIILQKISECEANQ